jgi:hypothetical protein
MIIYCRRFVKCMGWASARTSDGINPPDASVAARLRFRGRTIGSLFFHWPTHMMCTPTRALLAVSHPSSRLSPPPVLSTMQHPTPLTCSCMRLLVSWAHTQRELAERCLQPRASHKPTFAIPHIKTSRKHLKTSHETLCNMKWKKLMQHFMKRYNMKKTLIQHESTIIATSAHKVCNMLKISKSKITIATLEHCALQHAKSITTTLVDNNCNIGT